MLCSEIKESDLPKYKEWQCQEKKDGIRAILEYNHGAIKITNRRGVDITHRYPELKECITPCDKHFIFDGEIVAKSEVFTDVLTRDLNNNPGRISILAKCLPVKFCIFDCLEVDNNELRICTYEERQSNIMELRFFFGNNIKYIGSFNDPENFFRIMKENKKEGIVLKRPGSIYHEGKRSTDWLKVKCWKESSIVFDGYEANSAGITVTNKKGIRVLVAGSMHSKVKRLIDESGSAELTIQYLSKASNGALRMPTFKGITKEVEADK
jgi:ATP-dependent DNA ligase